MTGRKDRKLQRKAYNEMKSELYKKYLNEENPTLKELFKKRYDDFVKYKGFVKPNEMEGFIGG